MQNQQPVFIVIGGEQVALSHIARLEFERGSYPRHKSRYLVHFHDQNQLRVLNEREGQRLSNLLDKYVVATFQEEESDTSWQRRGY